MTPSPSTCGYCLCGCGTKIPVVDVRNRPRKYAIGHTNKGKSNTWSRKEQVNWWTTHERARKIKKAEHCEISHIGGCGGRFEIHHIDGNPWNNDVSNLSSLCVSHHRLIEKKRIDIKNPVMIDFYKDGSGKRRYL